MGPSSQQLAGKDISKGMCLRAKMEAQKRRPASPKLSQSPSVVSETVDPSMQVPPGATAMLVRSAGLASPEPEPPPGHGVAAAGFSPQRPLSPSSPNPARGAADKRKQRPFSGTGGLKPLNAAKQQQLRGSPISEQQLKAAFDLRE